MRFRKREMMLARFIWRYLRHKKIYIVGFFLIVLIGASEISIGSYLLKKIIDTVVQSKMNEASLIKMLGWPCSMYIALLCLMNVNSRLSNYLSLRFHPDIKSAVYKDLFTYVLNHSHNFFQNQFTGALSRKITEVAENMEPLLMIPINIFGQQLLGIIIASLTLMHVIHPILGLVLLSWGILYVFSSFKLSKLIRSLAQQRAEARSNISGTISDILTNHISAKLFDTYQYEREYLDRGVSEAVYRDRNFIWYNLKVNFFQNLALTLLLSTMMVLLVSGLVQGWVTAGDFALVISLCILISSSLFMLSQQIQFYAGVIGTCMQALSVIHQPHEITDSQHATALRIDKGEICFNDVSFYYLTNKPLFKNLNITIRPGEKVGLVGYSGGGKSSFFKLILRLMEVTEGGILIDGQDIKSITQSSLVRQIAVIQQEPELFHRSILDNIRYGKIDASEEEVKEIAKKTRCHEFIMALPQQYHSLVGERGVKLSVGQKQRISIARAFLKNAPILLLDEATSSLDSMNERSIQEALDEIMTNRTTLVIAHRLSTLQKMQRILVFVDGKIVEDGTLCDLLENNAGHFYKLWHLQKNGFIQ